MASVNSTSGGNTNSIFNLYGLNNKTKMAGLASGLDTQSIVEAMLTGTRSKIAKQQQDKSLYTWKQTAYRNTASTMRAFQTKYLDSAKAGSTTWIGSSSFFNTFKGNSTSNKVSFDSSTTTANGSVTVQRVINLATSQKMTVNQVYGNDLENDAVDLKSQSFYGKTLDVFMGDVTVTSTSKKIRLDSLDLIDKTLSDTDYAMAVEAELNRLFEAEIGTQLKDKDAADIPSNYVPILTSAVTTSGGKFSIELKSASSRVTVATKSDELGFEQGDTNRLDMSGKLSDFITGLAGDAFTFKINDASITVKADDSINTLMKKINASPAGVRLNYNERTMQFEFTATKTGSGNNIRIEDVSGNLMQKFVGARGGSTMTSEPVPGNNHLGYHTSVEGTQAFTKSDLENTLHNNHDKKLQFKIDVNGVEKTITVGPIAERVQMKDASGNPKLDSDGNPIWQWDGKSADKYLEEQVNKAIKQEFGSNSGVSFRFTKTDGDGTSANPDTYTAGFATPDNIPVTLTAAPGSNVDFLSAFGLSNNLTNDHNDGVTLNDIMQASDDATGTVTIKDRDGSNVNVTWNKSDTLRDFLEKMNTAFYGKADNDGKYATLQGGKLLLNAQHGELYFQDSTAKGVMAAMFGKQTHDGTSQSGLVDNVEGKNAQIVVNDQVVTSSTNSFVVDNIGFTIHDKTADSGEAITISAQADTDELVDKISSFINDYNLLIESLSSMIYEEKAGGYTPLSEEQKAQMSSDEIEKWEAEAKKGILRNDMTLRSIVSDLRQTMMTKVEAAGIALYDIGITTESYTKNSNSSGLNFNYSKAGRLEISNEKRLREAIQAQPDAIRTLFTHHAGTGEDPKTAGLADLLNSAIDRAAKETSDPKKMGTLVRIAGPETKLGGDNRYELPDKITQIDNYIATLKRKLESEYNRHWSKFTALETAISKMNAQAGWLADFGG